MENLVQEIIADGVVDATEVSQLTQAIMEDGVVDRNEVEALFKINDAVSEGENDPSYRDFFVKAVSSCVLEDETSPGVVDQEEGDWLAGLIEGDGALDETEQALLVNLRDNATSIESERLNDLIALLP